MLIQRKYIKRLSLNNVPIFFCAFGEIIHKEGKKKKSLGNLLRILISC